MKPAMLSGWGRFPCIACRVSRPRTEGALAGLLREGRLIARGNGRAYGDSAMNEACTVDMRHFKHMLGFDAQSGQLTAEAGVILGDVITSFLPRGWFPPVTPGTKFVTIGGMIAADVHGKNHHRQGSFGSFVDWIDVMKADGEVVRCSRDHNRDLFEWTIGGMGLTGIILRASFRLSRVETGWIRQTLIPSASLDATIEAFESNLGAAYSVAWIDCRTGGRALVMLGEHAKLGELPPHAKADAFAMPRRKSVSVPFDLPSVLLSPLVIRAFNHLQYWTGRRRAGQNYVDWDSYFYPLDRILDWNRIYGRKGLVQFQCVLPLEHARAGLQALQSALSVSKALPMLAVLKRMGPQESRFSFPMEGYTLALDFKAKAETLALLNELDRITLDHGGRFYLAKDSRMSAETFRASERRHEEFLSMRTETGTATSFASAQSERLKL
jgi:decaprenylphospho-beta-D-ribofuranose 2-oxidase